MIELERLFEEPTYIENIENFGVGGFPEVGTMSIEELDVLEADVMQRLEASKEKLSNISWMSSELSEESKEELDNIMKLSTKELDVMQAEILQKLSKSQTNFRKHLEAISNKK